MGLIRDSDVQRIPGFPLGIDNTSDERALAAGALRQARNVDIDKDGITSRRGGRVRRWQVAGLHSVWGHDQHPVLLGRLGQDLITIDPANSYATTVVATGLGNDEASFDILNGEVLWTVRGRGTGRIDALGVNRALGVPTPAGCSLSAASNGGLPAGHYQVTVSYLDAEGEMSGAPRAQAIELAENGAIVVTLPAAPAGVAETRVWLSEPNGRDLYWARDVDADVASVILTALAQAQSGMELEAQLHVPLPAGQIVRESNGIVLMAEGSILWYGAPMRPRLHHPGKHFIPFTDEITLVQPVGEGGNAGFFVGAGKRTYFLASAPTPKQATIRFARVAGAVPGTGLSAPGELFGFPQHAQVAYWMGADGKPCVGLPGGEVRVLAPRTAMTQFERGASLIREANSRRQVLTAGPVGPVAAMTASDIAEVFHYRNGIPVP